MGFAFGGGPATSPTAVAPLLMVCPVRVGVGKGEVAKRAPGRGNIRSGEIFGAAVVRRLRSSCTRRELPGPALLAVGVLSPSTRRFDLLLERLGMSNAAVAKVNELKAPMPGLIVDIRVQPGQAVLKGDPLLVLEAMKMENILKAPADGTVSSIKVTLRDNVQKGQVLVQFA